MGGMGDGGYFVPRDELLVETGCQWPMTMAAMRTGMKLAMMMDELAILQYVC